MPTPKLTRRTFLQASAAALASTTANLRANTTNSPHQLPQIWPEIGTLIPDDGWRLWVDEHAEWKSDTIHLPEDVTPQLLATLPVNPPTGGWEVLSPQSGTEVILPSTVEQHLWGKFGLRPYTPEEYRYAATTPPVPPADDAVPQNGAFLGVSWWHRNINIPGEMRGNRIFLHVRGARLRAEIYLNRKLVGYSIMEELPFEADLTAAANPGGDNHLAIRITNPFGRYDWVDGLNAQWGAVKLYRSHGFGGLDRGLSLSAHQGVRIKDLYALNLEDTSKISVFATTEAPPGEPSSGTLHFEVLDPSNPRALSKFSSEITHHAGSDLVEHTGGMGLASRKLWDLEAPHLYHLRATWIGGDGHTDTRTVPFGFRWFAPSGLGTDAQFRLNGRRIKLYTSISWGFWGLNGLFPTPELAEKEVTQAKKLNLNCLNFHRNVGKEEVFRAHDRLGLLRYMEPGAGKLAIGAPAPTVSGDGAIANPGVALAKPRTEADSFAQRFMVSKCLHMVRAFRSHPSLIQYTVQNEIGADLRNPNVEALLKAMHQADPSRSVVLNDGFSPPPRNAAQAWYEPYNDHLHRSDDPKEPFALWWNNHQGAGDQWYDEFYKSPTQFTYRSPYHQYLTEFGEMEGCATPDNHSLMIHQITQTYRKYGGQSYDLVDHQEIVAAYDRFLDKWGFRQAFPSTEKLWLSLGSKCYTTWQNYMENARISDDLDFAAISGWESTAIENHSGIVDNLRNFKSDPRPISDTLSPIRPVAKQHSASIVLGQPATFDLFLLNDTGAPVHGTLIFTAVTPSGKLLNLVKLPAPVSQRPDTFSYLLQENVASPPLIEEGLYRFRFALSSSPAATQVKEIWVANPTPRKLFKPLRIAVSGITRELRKQLSDLSLGAVEDFRAGGRYDLIVSSGLTSATSTPQNAGETTGLEAAPPSNSNSRKPEPGEGRQIAQIGRLSPGILEAVRGGTPLFAIPGADTLSEGLARELSGAGAFSYAGAVGDFRAPWMGNWYFVRKHPIFEGLPVDQVLGVHYQARGRQSNGLLIDHPANSARSVEIISAYSRDHDRNIGAGTFTCRLGQTKVLFHRIPEFHPALQGRFLANALHWLTT